MCMLSKIIDTYQLEGGGGGLCPRTHTHPYLCMLISVLHNSVARSHFSAFQLLQKVKGNEDLTAQCVRVCLASCVTTTKCH